MVRVSKITVGGSWQRLATIVSALGIIFNKKNGISSASTWCALFVGRQISKRVKTG